MSIQTKINFVNFNSEQNITQDSEKISILFTMSTIENQTWRGLNDRPCVRAHCDQHIGARANGPGQHPCPHPVVHGSVWCVEQMLISNYLTRQSEEQKLRLKTLEIFFCENVWAKLHCARYRSVEITSQRICKLWERPENNCSLEFCFWSTWPLMAGALWSKKARH